MDVPNGNYLLVVSGRLLFRLLQQPTYYGLVYKMGQVSSVSSGKREMYNLVGGYIDLFVDAGKSSSPKVEGQEGAFLVQ